MSPQRLADLLTSDLRRRILDGELADGEPLPAAVDLIAQYGASRPTVRECLRVLESERLVASDGGVRPVYVAQRPSTGAAARILAVLLHLERAAVADVLEAMQVVERPLAGWLLTAGPERIETLAGADPATLHEALARQQPNRTSQTVLDVLQRTLALAGRKDRRCRDEAGSRTHELILGHLYAGRLEEFEQSWREHLAQHRSSRTPAFRVKQDIFEVADESPVDRVARELRGQILGGDLTPGDRLPAMPDLQEQYAASRTHLRAALRILETEGLVAIQLGGRGGVDVAMPGSGTPAHYLGLLLHHRRVPVEDFMRMRESIELEVAAAMAAADADTSRLLDAWESEAAAIAEPARFADMAIDFHGALATTLGSPGLALMFSLVDEVLALAAGDRIDRSPDGASRVEKAHQEHRGLVDLLAAGETAEARDLWSTHVAYRPREGDDKPLDIFALERRRAFGRRQRW